MQKLIIPAAGLGTRLLPATKVVPKELFPLGTKPMLHYALLEAAAAGFKEVILVVSPRKQNLADYLAKDEVLESQLTPEQETLLSELETLRRQLKLTAVLQEEAKGLGHAILMARHAVGDEPFAVLLPDDLIFHTVPGLKQMLPLWEIHQAACIAVRHVPQEQLHRYGVIAPRSSAGRIHHVSRLIEKPRSVAEAPSSLAVVGRYLLPAQTFAILADLTPGAGGEIQLTDALQVLAEQNDLLAYEFEGKHFDAGNPVGWLQAQVATALADETLAPQVRLMLKEFL